MPFALVLSLTSPLEVLTHMPTAEPDSARSGRATLRPRHLKQSPPPPPQPLGWHGHLATRLCAHTPLAAASPWPVCSGLLGPGGCSPGGATAPGGHR